MPVLEKAIRSQARAVRPPGHVVLADGGRLGRDGNHCRRGGRHAWDEGHAEAAAGESRGGRDWEGCHCSSGCRCREFLLKRGSGWGCVSAARTGWGSPRWVLVVTLGFLPGAANRSILRPDATG